MVNHNCPCILVITPLVIAIITIVLLLVIDIVVLTVVEEEWLKLVDPALSETEDHKLVELLVQELNLPLSIVLCSAIVVLFMVN